MKSYSFLQHLIPSMHRGKPTGLLGELMEGPSDINTCNNIQASILGSFCCIGKKSLNVKILCCCKAPLSTRFIIYPLCFPFPPLSLPQIMGCHLLEQVQHLSCQWMFLCKWVCLTQEGPISEGQMSIISCNCNSRLCEPGALNYTVWKKPFTLKTFKGSFKLLKMWT